MNSKRRIEWIGSVDSEGGPVMVCDLASFAQWTGATPFAELRELDPKFAAAAKDRMSTLHYWGQFTDRLPAPFTADGGHQFLKFATEAEAKAKLAELRRAMTEKFPAIEISEEDDGSTQFHLAVPGDEDGEMMQAELAPSSEYDASWQDHDEDEAWTYAFGKSGKGLFWDMGGSGVTEVGVSADGNEIVLLRTWVDEDEDEETARALVDAKHEEEGDGGELTVKGGHAVVMWSPVAPFQLEGMKAPEDIAKLAKAGVPKQLDMEDIDGVGVMLSMKEGRWAVSFGTTEADEEDDESDHDHDHDGDHDNDNDNDNDNDSEGDDDSDGEASWSCRWCRLTWIGN